MSRLLEVRNLTIGIKKDSAVLKPVKGISFNIDEGEIIGLAGKSGCGKTLTALSIANLLPDAVKIFGGDIVFDKKDFSMSMIFQDIRQSLNPLMKVGSQITETLELKGFIDKAQNKSKALEMLLSLGFNEPEKILNAYPHQLSGGMCQRVLAAIAAIGRPKLLLADEPSSALDDESQDRILSLLSKMNRDYKTSVLIISHDLSIIRRFCSRFLIMFDGRIVEEGPAAMFNSPVHPFTKALIKAIPEKKQEDQETESPPKEAKPLLSIRGVSNTYVSRRFSIFGKKEIKPVLKDINLELYTSEIFGLTGKSGCGKTTLARCILGLIDYKGEILFYDQKSYKTTKVQIVFQEPGASLNPRKKIGRLIEEPLVIHKMGKPREREILIDRMLLLVGLDPSYKSRRVHELSGGQKQRVCIARSLILQPDLLIADEAISSLDAVAGMQILNLFRELNKNTGLSILFISHNKEAVQYLCGRTAVMKDGKLYLE